MSRIRKPYREFRVNDSKAPHGVKSSMIVRIYRDGTLEVRELRRRTHVSTTVATIYVDCLRAEILALRPARKIRIKRK